MARRQWSVFATLSAAVVCLVAASAQDQGATRQFTVVGSHNAFRPGNL
jgi:hypothetical protein